MFQRILAVVLIAASAGANATGLDISLSNTSAKFAYLTESGSLGYAGADVGYSFFYNETGDNLLSGTVMVVGNAVGAQRAFQYGFGARANYGKLKSGEFTTAIGIGGTLRYLFPSQNPVGLTLEAFSSPAITSFGDTQNIFESAARIDLEVMPNTRGYLGYRLIEVEHKTLAEKYKVDDAIVFGVRLSF